MVDLPKDRVGWILLGGVVLFHFILGMIPWPWYKSVEPLIAGWIPISYFSMFFQMVKGHPPLGSRQLMHP